MKYTVGILIIGSLLWDKNKIRQEWRNSRLKQHNIYDVLVPIRYGRKSGNRGNTFTMVFSRLCYYKSHGLGVGKVIPLKNIISNSCQLIYEAESLWDAERKSYSSNKRISANWGCVTLMINPTQKNYHDIFKQWKIRISKESSYGKISNCSFALFKKKN